MYTCTYIHIYIYDAGSPGPPRHDGSPPLWSGVVEGGVVSLGLVGLVKVMEDVSPPQKKNECCLLLNLITFHAYGNTEIIEICMCFAGVLGEGMLKSKK